MIPALTFGSGQALRISAAEAAKITAERAEQARRDMLRKQQEAAERRVRARRQNAILASVACLVLLGGILATALVIVDMAPAPDDKLAGSPKGAAVAPLSADTEAFIATRKAVVRFAESPRYQCRQVDFNNESGMFSNEVKVRCNDDVPQNAAQEARNAEAAVRFDSIRGNFMK
jgi:hypothetical protein